MAHVKSRSELGGGWQGEEGEVENAEEGRGGQDREGGNREERREQLE